MLPKASPSMARESSCPIPVPGTSLLYDHLLLAPRSFIQKGQVQKDQRHFYKIYRVFFYMSSILGTGGHCRGTQGACTQSCDPYPYDLAPCPSNKRIQVTEPERSWNLLGLFWAELPPRWSPTRLAWACHEEEERYMVSGNGRAVSLIFQLGL